MRPDVGRFFGNTNWIEATVDQDGKVKTEIGTMHVDRAREIRSNEKVLLGIRAEHVLLDSRTLGHNNEFQAHIRTKTLFEGLIQYELQVGQKVIISNRMDNLDCESSVVVRIPPDKVIVFPLRTSENG